MGSTLLKHDKFSEALEYLQAALEVFRRINSCYYEAEVLNSLAKIYLDLGNYHIANECCTKGLAIATELELPLAQECQELMEKIKNNEQ